MKKIAAFILLLFLTMTAFAEAPSPDNLPLDTPVQEETSESSTDDTISDATDADGTEEDEDIPPVEDGEAIPPTEDGENGVLPPTEDDAEEPLPENGGQLPPNPDFSDDMETSLKMFAVSENIIFETIPENQYGEFYEDYTIAQRTVKSEEYIIYDLPYWTSAEITAYFYQNEEINHFIISASADNIEYTEIIAEPEIISENGKWHKVVYSFDKTSISQRYIKISWQNLEETGFTNWGQALGAINVYNEDAVISGINYLSDEKFAIPDSGEAECPLNADVCDQMGKPFPDATVAWQEFSDEIVSLTADGILKVTSTNADNLEYSFTAFVHDTEVSLTVTVFLMHYPPGDIDSDFKITPEDLALAGKKFMREAENDGEKRGDIDKDGKIGIYDLAYISYNMEDVPEQEIIR